MLGYFVKAYIWACVCKLCSRCVQTLNSESWLYILSVVYNMYTNPDYVSCPSSTLCIRILIVCPFSRLQYVYESWLCVLSVVYNMYTNPDCVSCQSTTICIRIMFVCPVSRLQYVYVNRSLAYLLCQKVTFFSTTLFIWTVNMKASNEVAVSMHQYVNNDYISHVYILTYFLTRGTSNTDWHHPHQHQPHH